MFIGGYRISHACLTLQFDHYLTTPFKNTYIFCPRDAESLDRIFKKYNIDTSNFIYVTDEEMNRRYPETARWWFSDDYRGSWLYQQALKLASLDMITDDVVMIQDADTFFIKPYSCIVDGKPNYPVILNETHSPGYYQVLQNSLGIDRQTPHCFVSEFMPVFREDWLSLKDRLESRNNKHFLDAIIDNVPVDTYDNLRWFSEYEFVGNWVMTQREVVLSEQKRFEYDTLDQLNDLTLDYDCACDGIPKLADSIILDYSTETITNFDQVFSMVKKFV